MEFLLLHIWPYMAAALGLGLVAGALAEWTAARAARRRMAAPPERRGAR